jgi:hypothetical protein
MDQANQPNKYVDSNCNIYQFIEHVFAYELYFQIRLRRTTILVVNKKLGFAFRTAVSEQVSALIESTSKNGATPTLEFVDKTYTTMRYTIVCDKGETISLILNASCYHELEGEDGIKSLDGLGKKCFDALMEEVQKNQALRIALYMKDLEIAKLQK